MGGGERRKKPSGKEKQKKGQKKDPIGIGTPPNDRARDSPRQRHQMKPMPCFDEGEHSRASISGFSHNAEARATSVFFFSCRSLADGQRLRMGTSPNVSLKQILLEKKGNWKKSHSSRSRHDSCINICFAFFFSGAGKKKRGQRHPSISGGAPSVDWLAKKNQLGNLSLLFSSSLPCQRTGIPPPLMCVRVQG